MKNVRSRRMKKIIIIAACSLITLLFASCSDWTGEEAEEIESGKGAIIINLSGVPDTSRAMSIPDAKYSIEFMSLDEIDPETGFYLIIEEEFSLTAGSARITLDPGQWEIYTCHATLNDNEIAFLDSYDPNPVEVTTGNSTKVSITLHLELDKYLAEYITPAMTELSLGIPLDSQRWDELLDAIDASSITSLNLSDCTVKNDEFNPSGGSQTAKAKIVSLTLPAAAKSIPDGTSSNPTFEYFDILTTLNTGGVEIIGEYAFSGLSALEEVTLGKVTEIGIEAFVPNSNLITVKIGELVELGYGLDPPNNSNSIDKGFDNIYYGGGNNRAAGIYTYDPSNPNAISGFGWVLPQ